MTYEFSTIKDMSEVETNDFLASEAAKIKAQCQEAVSEDVPRPAAAPLPKQPIESPQQAAITQMAIETYWREIAIRARLIEAERLLAAEIAE